MNIRDDFGAPLKDLDGKVLTNVDSGLVGFTGFDPQATQTLGVVATMLEKGIPVGSRCERTAAESGVLRGS